MSLRITQYGESILHKEGKPVVSFDEQLKELSNAMLESMKEAEGISKS